MLTKLFVTIIIYALSAAAAAGVVKGVNFGGVMPLFAFVIALILVNMFLKPVLKILTFPVNILTLGFVGGVINLLMLVLADWLVADVSIDGFSSLILFALTFSILSSILLSLSKAMMWSTDQARSGKRNDRDY